MSLKPPKKSDLNKSWMKNKPDRVIKIHPEYHLIVTEGTDTEPAYFGTIKEIINKQYPDKIQLNLFGEGDNTISLFEKAKALAGNNSNIYKHVWILYDTDDFPAAHIDCVLQLCADNSTEETEFHAIWSNQCIELWFLLHFSFMQSDIHRTEYWPKLTECLKRIGAGEYAKNRTDMYCVLRPYMDTAIANAKSLDAINYGKAPSKAAPGTKVYELVERLRPYLVEEEK
ncbi:MAG: RloB family protein [Clostridia bacterium]|nr:RloB family protein [Clostridia bacterium]